MLNDILLNIISKFPTKESRNVLKDILINSSKENNWRNEISDILYIINKIDNINSDEIHHTSKIFDFISENNIILQPEKEIVQIEMPKVIEQIPEMPKVIEQIPEIPKVEIPEISKVEIPEIQKVELTDIEKIKLEYEKEIERILKHKNNEILNIQNKLF